MQVKTIKQGDVFASNERFGYFGWPSAAMMPDGKVAIVCSADRLEHVCPFGKVAVKYYDPTTGEFSAAHTLLDTPLDDRDAGICVNGDTVLVTTFNNKISFQRNYIQYHPQENRKIIADYLDTLVPESHIEDKYLGSLLIKSTDGGKTFGDIIKAPVSAPHGPTVTNDGEYLYAGINFKKLSDSDYNTVSLYSSSDGENWQLLNEIDVSSHEGLCFVEPHALQTKQGRIILLCRVQDKDGGIVGKNTFSVYQAVSDDNGKTFTPFRSICKHGSPPHIIQLADGRILVTYGYRIEPFGVRAIVSSDDGNTYGEELVICDDFLNYDGGYPASVELADGSIFTVYYYKEKSGASKNCRIGYKIWRI